LAQLQEYNDAQAFFLTEFTFDHIARFLLNSLRFLN